MPKPTPLEAEIEVALDSLGVLLHERMYADSIISAATELSISESIDPYFSSLIRQAGKRLMSDYHFTRLTDPNDIISLLYAAGGKDHVTNSNEKTADALVEGICDERVSIYRIVDSPTEVVRVMVRRTVDKFTPREQIETIENQGSCVLVYRGDMRNHNPCQCESLGPITPSLLKNSILESMRIAYLGHLNVFHQQPVNQQGIAQTIRGFFEDAFNVGRLEEEPGETGTS